MKKIIFVIIGIVSVVMFSLFINSCVQEKALERKHEKTEAVAYAQVQEQIALLNAQYSVNFMPETRGKKKGGFFRRLFQVLKSDLCGAATCAGLGGWGAALGAVSFSMCEILKSDDSICFPDDDSEDNEEFIVTPGDDTILKEEFLYTTADSVGYFHNKIIFEIYEENEEGFYSMDVDTFMPLVKSKVTKYMSDGFVPNRLLDKITNDVKQKLNLYINLTENVQMDPIDALEEMELEEEQNIVIVRGFCEAAESLLDDREALINYTTEFQNIVASSNLSNSSKEFIEVAVSVGGNSGILWGRGAEPALD